MRRAILTAFVLAAVVSACGGELQNREARRIAVPGSLKRSYVKTPAGEAAMLESLVELKAGGETRQDALTAVPIP